MNLDSDGLREIANTAESSQEADVVFVHGLGGGSHGTWSHGKQGQPGHFFWPEELGKDLPHCGIWTVGYPAGLTAFGRPGMIIEKRAGNLSQKLANAGVGVRPLIFITHSMAGLIVKSLIVGSQILPDVDRKRLVDMIRGIVFCATPHRGSAFADAAGVLGTFFGGSQGHVDEMRANAEPLDILHDQFIEWHRSHPIPVESYAENIGLFRVRWWSRPLPLGLVVPRSSANPGIAGHTVRDVDDDHLTLVKPRDRRHDVYAGVLRFIRDALARDWRNKLHFLKQEEAKGADHAQKFNLAEQIKDAKSKIAQWEEASATSAFRAEFPPNGGYVPGKVGGRKDEAAPLSGTSTKDRSQQKKFALLGILLIALLITAAISWWTSRNILSSRKIESIASEFVNDRISSQLRQYYDKELVDEKTQDHELLRGLEIKHGLFSGTLTRRYFDRIQELVQKTPTNPDRLLDALVSNYRFADAESLALTLATKEEDKTFPNYRKICDLYNSAGWVAMCQDGYSGFYAQWLAVSQDQYARAIDHFNRADLAAEHSQDPRLKAGPQYGIATVRFRLGKCREAELPIRESVLARKAEKGDEKNSSNLEARTLLGQVLLECGDVTEAEKELKAVYDIRTASSPGNPDTLRSWCNWGNALRAQNNNKAEEEHRKVFDKCRAKFTSENILTLYCHYSYAQTLSALGKSGAENEFRQVTRLLQTRFPKNRLTLDSLYQFACHLRKVGKLDEAANFSKEALEGRRDLLGKEHPDTIKAGNLLEELQAGK